MPNELDYGFKVEKYLELQDLGVLEVNENVPMILQKECPADGVTLKTVCTFFGNKGAVRLRLGCCPTCGYAGYIDRPEQKWVEDFYLTRHKDAHVVNIDAEIRSRRSKFSGRERARITDVKNWFDKFGIDIDRRRPICELGSSTGGTLNAMRSLGFQHLVGVENSERLATVARGAYDGLEIITSPFEDSATQAHLKKIGPFSLMFSHHVLEHVHHPGEFIRLSAGLQEVGDYFLISLPRQEGEFSMNIMAFLPHLHSFTAQSLDQLLQKNGYRILDSISDNRDLYFFARKESTEPLTPRKYDTSVDHIARLVGQLTTGLGLGVASPRHSHRVWWHRKIDVGGKERMLASGLLEKLHHRIRLLQYKWRHRGVLVPYHRGVKKILRERLVTQSLQAQSLEKRYSSYAESPIEIQFEGNIQMLYK